MSLPLRRAGCRQQYDSRAREDALAIQLYTFWGEDFMGAEDNTEKERRICFCGMGV